MPQTPYATQSLLRSTHITTAGTVFVNTGAVMSVNINNMTTAAVGPTANFYNTVGTITETTEVAGLQFPDTFIYPAKIDLGPPGVGLVINTGTLAIVTTGTVDLTIAYR